MSKIIITFAIFSLAAALPDNYYGAPTDSPMPPQPPQPPTVAPPPQPTTTTTTVAPPPEPTTSEPPTEDLIQALTTAGEFTQLIKAITDAGLTDELKSIAAATIFAPNDDAFKKLPAGTIEGLSPEDLKKVVKR